MSTCRREADDTLHYQWRVVLHAETKGTKDDEQLRFANAVGMQQQVMAASASIAVAKAWPGLRFGFPRPRRFPVFVLTAILTLALVIGAATAIFSVTHGVLLRTPGQLYSLHVPTGPPSGASSSGDATTSFSRPAFEALRQNRRAFSEVMAFAPLSKDKVAVQARGAPQEETGEMVSGNFFSGLGVKMLLGTGFNLEDERRHTPMVVLSLDCWTKLFQRDPGVLGQTIYIKGIPFAILGVTGEGFSGVDPSQPTDFWIPLESRPELNPWGNSPDENTLYGSPNWWCLRLLARLARGVDAQGAVAEATPGLETAAYASLGKPDPSHPKVMLALVPAKDIPGAD
ncbi:MAG TPA: ABC transporter permease [Acidobacteriaceae bacterium]|jgi:hypothetical protein